MEASDIIQNYNNWGFGGFFKLTDRYSSQFV